MARHTRFGWWKDQQGAVINGETLTVTLTGTTTVATIYEDEVGGSAITNGAITLSSVGFFQYWVDDGAPDNYASTQKFRHTFTGAKFTTLTQDDVVVFPGMSTTSTDTLTNKKLVDASVSFVDDGDNTKQLKFQCSGIAVATTRTVTVLDVDGTMVLLAATQTLTGKKIGDPSTPTKAIAFTLSGATAGKTMTLISAHSDDRSITFPNLTGTIALLTGAQSFSSKTYASPIVTGSFSGNAFLDEDDMASDSAVKVSSQQAIKKYVDDNTITLGTEQASGSGTAIDFTGIPAGTKKITIMLVGVSTDGTNALQIQLGDAGGIEATGYVSAVFGSGGDTAETAAFLLTRAVVAAGSYSGQIILTLEDSAGFTWVSSSAVSRTDTAAGFAGSGSKSLSGVLDRVRITSNGTPDDFDAGAINIQYE